MAAIIAAAGWLHATRTSQLANLLQVSLCRSCLDLHAVQWHAMVLFCFVFFSFLILQSFPQVAIAKLPARSRLKPVDCVKFSLPNVRNSRNYQIQLGAVYSSLNKASTAYLLNVLLSFVRCNFCVITRFSSMIALLLDIPGQRWGIYTNRKF